MKTSVFLTTVALPALLCLLLCPSQGHAAVRFFGLGDLPGGVFISYPSGVSDDGSVVVGFSKSSVGNEGFRWTRNGGIQRLSGLPANAVATEALDVSSDGRYVVATLVTAGTSTAIRWSIAQGVEDLANLAGGASAPTPRAISENGAVIAGLAFSSNGGEPFRWTSQGGMVGLNDLVAGTSSSGQAWGISADGSVVVGQALSASGQQGFVWTPTGGMKGVGDLPGGDFNSHSQAVSPDGTVIVGNSTSADGVEAFLWTLGGGIQKLDWPTGASGYSTALGVSTRGEVIVGRSVIGDVQDALIQNADGLRTVKAYALTLGANVTGWQLIAALDVSANGRHIVGYGFNPSGGGEGWILSILPDPPTLTLTSKPKVRTKKNGKFKVEGTASDDASVVRVEYQLGGKGAWTLAQGTNAWLVTAKLKKSLKKTNLLVRSVDEEGQTSGSASVRIHR